MMNEMLFGFIGGVMAGLMIALPMVDRYNKRAKGAVRDQASIPRSR